MTAKQKRRYSQKEEWANTIIHGFALFLSFPAVISLLFISARNGDAKEIVVCAIYGIAMILVYAASTIYHAVHDAELKRKLRYYDHIAIFLMIAGTYTPFSLLGMGRVWGWTVFWLIWFFAIVGTVYEIFFLDRYKWISISIYLGMGWTVIVAIKPFIDAVSFEVLLWAIAGGLLYTIGAVFYMLKKMPYSHAIWHFFTVAGTVAHFVGIVSLLDI
ncbi:hemolysin III family protein [bacterium]|nr:hemolysin III family protein [bacterium]